MKENLVLLEYEENCFRILSEFERDKILETDSKRLDKILSYTKSVLFFLKKSLITMFVVVNSPSLSFAANSKIKTLGKNYGDQTIIIHSNKEDKTFKFVDSSKISKKVKIKNEKLYGEKYAFFLSTFVINKNKDLILNPTNNTDQIENFNINIKKESLVKTFNYSNFSTKTQMKIASFSKKNSNHKNLINLVIISLFLNFQFKRRKKKEIHLIRGGQRCRFQRVKEFFSCFNRNNKGFKTPENSNLIQENSFATFIKRNSYLLLICSVVTVLLIYYLRKFFLLHPRRRKLVIKKFIKWLTFKKENTKGIKKNNYKNLEINDYIPQAVDPNDISPPEIELDNDIEIIEL